MLRHAIATAGVFAAVGSAFAQGLPKRIWVDPPAHAVEASTISREATPWPDEAGRRTALTSNPPSAPRDAVATLDEPDIDPDHNATVSSLVPLPQPVLPSTRRRLGPLAGFTTLPQAELPRTREQTFQTEHQQTATMSRARERQMRRYLGQVRIVKFRKRRIVVMFTRF